MVKSERHLLWTGLLLGASAGGALVRAADNPILIGGHITVVNGAAPAPDGGRYVGGSFEDTPDFASGSPATTVASHGMSDGFFARYSAVGELRWVKTFGGISTEAVTDVKATPDGGVYVLADFATSASFENTPAIDFDPGVELALSPRGPGMAVAKYDANGALTWVRFFSANRPYSRRLALAPNGDVIVVGAFQGSVDFDPGADAVISSSAPAAGFVLRLTASGEYRWHFALPSQLGTAFIESAIVAPDGSVVIVGNFTGTVDFDPGPGQSVVASPSRSAGFVAAYEPDGALRWVRQLRGGENVFPGDLARDANDGALVIVGQFASADVDADPGPGVALLPFSGFLNGFVWKLTADGNFVWARAAGGAGINYAERVALLPDGAIRVAGYVDGPVDFDPGPGSALATQGSYVWALQPDGTLDWVRTVVTGYGSDPLAMLVTTDGIAIAGAFSQPATFTATGSGAVVASPDGLINAYAVVLNRSAELAPLLATPGNSSVPAGVPFSLTLTATSRLPASFSARGLPPGLEISSAGIVAGTPALAGDYAVEITVSSAAGARTVSWPLHVMRDPGQHLSNLSARAYLGAGHTIIGGVVVNGSGPRKLLVRGVGPTLRDYGVTTPASNPRLRFFQGQDVIATNDDWSQNAAATEIAALGAANGAFPLPAGSRDAALLMTLPPGLYTVQADNLGPDLGVALLELYDVSDGGDARMVNFSARGFSGSDEGQMIVGFGVRGAASSGVVVRAVGPTLAGFGVSGVHPDPTLRVVAGASTLMENDDWNTGGAALATAMDRVGAFSLPPRSKDAAVLLTLPAGAYSAVVGPAAGREGEVIVELYELPE